MKNVLEVIVKAICQYPEDVIVHEFLASSSSIIEIHVNKCDFGKIIGKGGKIIQSIRNIVYCASYKHKKRYSIEIFVKEDAESGHKIIKKDDSVEITNIEK